MAQIIKHRRGSINSIASVTANVGELVMGTGSLGDLTAPVLFVGESATAGGFRPVSKIYQGTSAPDLTTNTWGTTLNGTPFYSVGGQTLFILNNAGNTAMDLTGNIEGNVISGVTINVVSGTTANYQNISGSFTGSGIGLYDIPASGITGLNLSQIADGAVTASVSSSNGFRVNTNSIISGSLTVTGSTYTNSDVFITGNTYQTGSINLTGDVVLKGNISIGDSLTGDTVTLNGEISSSLIPAENQIFNLGSTGNTWNELHVHSAFIDNISISGISTTNLELPGFLTVSGQTTLSGSVLVEDLTSGRVVFAGTQGQLKDDSFFTYDTNSLLLSIADITLNGDSGDVGVPGLLNVTGATNLNSTLTVEGNTTINENLVVSGSTNYGVAKIIGKGTNQESSLAFRSSNVSDGQSGNWIIGVNTALVETGAFSLWNGANNSVFPVYVVPNGNVGINLDRGNGDTADYDLDIKGTLRATSTVYANSDIYVDQDVQISDELRVHGNVDVTGSVNLKNNLIVSGTTTISGSTYVQYLQQNRILLAGASGRIEDNNNLVFDTSKLQIGTGKFEVDVATGDIRTSGSLTVNNGTTINGNQTVNGSLTVTGATELKSSLVVSGATTIDDTLLVTGNSSLQGTLTVTGATSLLSGLTVNGNETVNGILTVTGATSLLSGLTVNGNETVNGILTVTGNTQLGGNLYVSGNLEVLGSATNVSIQSTTVEIGDNIILVNAYSPFQRYAGITGYDSGSAGTSGSLLWDSLNDYWIFQNSNATTSKIVGVSGGTMGSEASLTANIIPVAMSGNSIKDSKLGDDGTTLTYNTNKFTVASSDGATSIAGNVTLSSVGGADATNKTSAIVFKNSSNVLGYVSTTETTDVLDGILGYKNSNGALVFSTLIDGGTY